VPIKAVLVNYIYDLLIVYRIRADLFGVNEVQDKVIYLEILLGRLYGLDRSKNAKVSKTFLALLGNGHAERHLESLVPLMAVFSQPSIEFLALDHSFFRQDEMISRQPHLHRTPSLHQVLEMRGHVLGS
jgi:hypothetical protein